MASTSNKNTPGNYKAEQQINARIDTYALYENSYAGKAYSNYLPGDGLLPGSNARSTLCQNYVDVETQLRGIGSTNLVKPKAEVRPEFLPIESLNVIDRLPTLLPEPLIVQKDQRPQWS
jgi:hypothetical protein